MKRLLGTLLPSSKYDMPIRQARYAILQTLLLSKGLDADYLSWLDPSCNGGGQNRLETEARKAELVEVYTLAILAGMDITADWFAFDNCEMPNPELIFTGFAPVNAVVGATTVNRTSGIATVAAGQSTVTVTNSTVKTTSIVTATLRGNDATALYVKHVVPANGSFIITLNAAATANRSVSWIVENPLA